jgi:hypothetical protein
MRTFTLILAIFMLFNCVAAAILSIAIGSIVGTILALAAFMPTAFAVHALASL